ncbi:MAG: sensor histidine kinase [Pseudomonadota bacterium]|nr:sensor histidine kinase [Pseudomonadota bacterium]
MTAAPYQEPLQVAEIRHRMTNGFQLIQAYTRQQLRKCETPEARELVGRVLRQIQSVSSLQTAMGEADLGKFGAFLDQIEPHWQRLGEGQGIEVVVTRNTPQHLPKHISENAARILTEAITNALEQAFPDDRGGRIEVDAVLRNATRMDLRVADNGVGLQDTPGDGQGTAIIAKLAEELGGESHWHPREPSGCLLAVSFPVTTDHDIFHANGRHAIG